MRKPDVDLGALERMTRRAFRRAVTVQRAPEGASTQLYRIVRVGTKAEAVSAARAPCGYRVARIDEFDPAEQRRVKETCARARGDFFYWVPRNPVP